MKTRITVIPLQHNGELEPLSKMSAANNNGMTIISINDVCSYIKARSAIYPGLPMSYVANGNKLQIEADNKPFAILSWETVYDLSHTESDLLVSNQLS